MNRRQWGFIWILFFACVAVVFGGEKKFERKFTVSGGGLLTLETDAGDVRVSPGTGNEVQVSVAIKGRDRDLDKFEVTAEQSGTDVRIRGTMKKGGFWHSTDLDVSYMITVPNDYRTDLHTSGGDLEVSGLSGRVKGETSGGNVRLSAITGPVDVETSGGDMRAEKVTGDVKLETSGGDITIAGASGTVDAETSGGNVTLGDITGKVRAETSGGNITIKVLGDNKGIHAETSGGNIDIMIGKAVGASLDAGTSGGEVICDLPVTVSGKLHDSSIKGTVNGGGNLIYAHTSGGDIRIRALQ